MSQMEFVDQIIAVASKWGFQIDINRNGSRQITFEHKNLTEDHLRRVFQDIVRHRGLYSREDMEQLVRGRPCAVAPFFDLAIKAGLCQGVMNDRRKLYEFEFGSYAAAPAA
jgi:hypothetical protein